MDLTQKRCIPCEAGTPPLDAAAVAELAKNVPDWKVISAQKLSRELKFRNFQDAMAFVNRVADIAETEGHHPDIHISYSVVTIELWTHAVKGLSENDFILAAKIEHLLGA